MKIMSKNFLGLAAILCVFSATSFAGQPQPAWCKATSLSITERLICNDATLSAADELLSQLYSEMMSYRGKEGYEGMWPREVYSNQKDWLTGRNKATTTSDILALYMVRLNALYAVMKNITQRSGSRLTQ